MNENLKFDLVSAHLRATHPEWSADKVFTESIEISGHTGGFGREVKAGDVGFTRKPQKKVGQHPALVEELSKHWQLEQQKKKWETQKHVERLKEIRKLMQERGLSFDEAFVQTMQGEPLSELGQAPAKAGHESEPQPAKQASQEKLMLIKGAHAGLAFNIHTGKPAAGDG